MSGSGRSGGRPAHTPRDKPMVASDEPKIRLYRESYEEGKRAVDDQMAELQSMRERSVGFIAFVGSATGFLVGTGLPSITVRTGWFFSTAAFATLISALAIVALISILLGLVVVRDGRRRRIHRAVWNFRNSPETLVRDWIEPDLGAHAELDFYRDLALNYETKLTENDPLLNQVRVSYVLLLTLGSLQIVAWSVVLWVFG